MFHHWRWYVLNCRYSINSTVSIENTTPFRFVFLARHMYWLYTFSKQSMPAFEFKHMHHSNLSYDGSEPNNNNCSLWEFYYGSVRMNDKSQLSCSVWPILRIRVLRTLFFASKAFCYLSTDARKMKMWSIPHPQKNLQYLLVSSMFTRKYIFLLFCAYGDGRSGWCPHLCDIKWHLQSTKWQLVLSLFSQR